MKTCDRICSTNPSIAWPQHMLEVLGKLQSHTADAASSSIYIYDLVDQHTLCASFPVAAMLGYTADAIHDMGAIGLASLIIHMI